MNETGKKVFLEAFETKMHDKIEVKGKEISYYQLLESEIRAYQKYVMKDEKYKPYKYY